VPVFQAEDTADYNQKQRKPTKSADVTPNYTTSWSQIPVVK